MRLGIAITTLNRSAIVQELVDAIATTTTVGYELVVCDDGSSDDTVSALRRKGVRVIAGSNRGVAWNKNRGLFFLLSETPCDVLLLLDDDVLPTSVGWESDWIAAAASLGHVNLAHPGRPEALIGGCSAKGELGLATMTAGACIASSRRAVAEVGFMDTRFLGYGHEHGEYTLRFVRAGYGGALWRPQPQQLLAFFYVLNSGIALREVTSSYDPRQAEENRALALRLRDEELYRHAWRDSSEREILLSELDAATGNRRLGIAIPPDFNKAAYLAANPDVAQSGLDPIYHFVAHGAAEGRRWAGAA